VTQLNLSYNTGNNACWWTTHVEISIQVYKEFFCSYSTDLNVQFNFWISINFSSCHILFLAHRYYCIVSKDSYFFVTNLAYLCSDSAYAKQMGKTNGSDSMSIIQKRNFFK
jgi:hypothetical protein